MMPKQVCRNKITFATFLIKWKRRLQINICLLRCFKMYKLVCRKRDFTEIHVIRLEDRCGEYCPSPVRSQANVINKSFVGQLKNTTIDFDQIVVSGKCEKGNLCNFLL